MLDLGGESWRGLRVQGPGLRFREILGSPIVEGRSRAFQDVNDVQIEFGRFDGSHRVLDPIAVRPVDMGVDDLFCITDDGDVRAVRNHDQLPALLHVLDDGNQQSVDRVVVQVLFRLIDDDRVAALVDEKIED